MIIYDLLCDGQHRFEGWFKNADEFQQQLQTGLLTCPVCGSEHVQKLPSASHISTGHGQKQEESNTPAQQGTAEVTQAQLVQLLHDYVNKHYDDVGSRFAEEAKKIHYGEAEARNIRGLATANEVKELKEEGISALQLPPAPYDKDKLN